MGVDEPGCDVHAFGVDEVAFSYLGIQHGFVSDDSGYFAIIDLDNAVFDDAFTRLCPNGCAGE